VTVHADGITYTAALSNTPFIIQSGSFRVVMDTIETQDVKVIECVTAGVLYMPSSAFLQTPTEAAFGDWEIWINHANAPNTDIIFVSSAGQALSNAAQLGYGLRVNSAESVEIREATGGASTELIGTADAYITAGEWVNYRVTRDSLGVFSLYVNDTLATVNVGTNPSAPDLSVTTSPYFTMNLGVGDKVAYSDLKGNHSIRKGLLG
jgi:hypothetical protein